MLQFNFEMWNWLLGSRYRESFSQRGDPEPPVIRSLTSVEFLSCTASVGAILKWRIARLLCIRNFKGRSVSFVGLLKALGFLVCSALPVQSLVCSAFLSLTTVTAFKESNMFCTLCLFTSSLNAILWKGSQHTTTHSTCIQDNRCPGPGLIKAQFPINDMNAENGLSYQQPLVFNPLIKQWLKSCFTLNYLSALTVLQIV